MAIASGFDAAGLSHLDGGSVGHLGVIFLEILAVTVVFLAVGKFGYGELPVKLGQYAVLAYFLGHFVGAFTGRLGVVEGAVGIEVSAVLWVHYEWHVLDAVAVAFGATAIAALGLGFALFPGTLVVSAAWFLDASAVVTVAGFPLGAPAVGAFRLREDSARESRGTLFRRTTERRGESVPCDRERQRTRPSITPSGVGRTREKRRDVGPAPKSNCSPSNPAYSTTASWSVSVCGTLW